VLVLNKFILVSVEEVGEYVPTASLIDPNSTLAKSHNLVYVPEHVISNSVDRSTSITPIVHGARGPSHAGLGQEALAAPALGRPPLTTATSRGLVTSLGLGPLASRPSMHGLGSPMQSRKATPTSILATNAPTSIVTHKVNVLPSMHSMNPTVGTPIHCNTNDKHVGCTPGLVSACADNGLATDTPFSHD
jgi:hypothetical protein